MPDDLDRAAEREALDRDLALRVRRPEGPAATGACLYCGEPLPSGVRWCATECRDDWERLDKRSLDGH